MKVFLFLQKGNAHTHTEASKGVPKVKRVSEEKCYPGGPTDGSPFFLRILNPNLCPPSQSQPRGEVLGGWGVGGHVSCTPCGSAVCTPRLTPRRLRSPSPQYTYAGHGPAVMVSPLGDCVTPVPVRCLHHDHIQRLATELDVGSASRRRIRAPAIRQLTPYLHLSGEDAVFIPSLLNQNGISHVLNVARRDTSRSGEDLCRALGIRYTSLDTVDDMDYPILLFHYEEFAVLIDAIRDEETSRVLVHCVAGVNRSVVLCVAYLVDRCGLDLITACRMVRGPEGDFYVLDNIGFRVQLIEFCLGRCPRAL